MTLQPDAGDSIFERIRSTIASLSDITNFSTNSPERAITQAQAEEQRKRQHELLSVQLSARVKYSGKTITEEDLRDLNVDPAVVDLELLNSYQDESDLDALAAGKGITRDPGSFATGTVTFQVTDDTATIDEGTVVTTPTDVDGDSIRFETTEQVSPAQGSSEVDADIRALERGADGNVGSGAITEIESPPPKVAGNPPVSNANATTGGESRETTPELRNRTELAIVGQAGGGTLEGVKSGLVDRFDGLDRADIEIDQDFANTDFDVVVDGGPSDSDLNAAIDDLQPVAVEGTLVRPTKITIDIDTTVSGTGIDTSAVEDDIRAYIENLGIGDDIVRDQVVATIITANDSVEGIDSLSTTANGTGFSDDYPIGATDKAEAGSVAVDVA